MPKVPMKTKDLIYALKHIEVHSDSYWAPDEEVKDGYRAINLAIRKVRELDKVKKEHPELFPDEPKTKSKGKTLDIFEWKMLVGAWRYYESRKTIAASMFPGNIISEYFTGKYSKETCTRIARQFSETDHGNGVNDWNWEEANDDKWKLEYHSWLKFYAFCRAYWQGFTDIYVVSPWKQPNDSPNAPEVHEAFFLETNGCWYPVKEYLKEPQNEIYIPSDWIIETPETQEES